MMVGCRMSRPFGGRRLGVIGALLLQLGVHWQTCHACETVYQYAHNKYTKLYNTVSVNTHQSFEPCTNANSPKSVKNIVYAVSKLQHNLMRHGIYVEQPHTRREVLLHFNPNHCRSVHLPAIIGGVVFKRLCVTYDTEPLSSGL